MSNVKSRCPICNGYKKAGETTFTVDLGFGVVVVRHVPAVVCEQCGAEWIDDKTAEELETVVNEARKKHAMVEVTEFSQKLAG
jgi:YgiT-type zinc finger domain-containing protein